MTDITNRCISIKEALRRRFADAANEFAMILNTVALEISDMQGDIEVSCSMSGPLYLRYVLI